MGGTQAEAGAQMESFFERVGRIWPVGRRDLHWHILPTPDEAGVLATSYQGLATKGLQSVPPEWMHCTLMHAVGLDRSDIDLDALLKDVASFAQKVRPFNLTFDRPAVGNFAVEISGWPGRPFTQLVDGLTEAMARTGGAFTAAPSRFPHLSVAYASDGAEGVDTVSLKAALADIEQPLSATVVADRLHLVEQWHDGAHIMWKPVATVPLAGVTG
ncbi:2'-5' RNA ligase family protein [Streptomyces sp. ITFR-16]|uniref:2'-5' RNA ligase family protein n=1 Tax=Streptomyces sp. ITFR-16 TaxID=3075198 RepID=UPI00288A989E|nr:2'-5' RNA ligase family protein [Streptomyces sp. ITFR-16]WNI27347.1 2'-5' RNA ligase family protein [Streptomyces sp. ITFR-16]